MRLIARRDLLRQNTPTSSQSCRRPPRQRRTLDHRHGPHPKQPRAHHQLPRTTHQRRAHQKREIIRCLKRYVAREIYNDIREPSPRPNPRTAARPEEAHQFCARWSAIADHPDHLPNGFGCEVVVAKAQLLRHPKRRRFSRPQSSTRSPPTCFECGVEQRSSGLGRVPEPMRPRQQLIRKLRLIKRATPNDDCGVSQRFAIGPFRAAPAPGFVVSIVFVMTSIRPRVSLTVNVPVPVGVQQLGEPLGVAWFLRCQDEPPRLDS